MKHVFFLFIIVLCFFFYSCSETLDRDFRQDMREFVQNISTYTKDIKSDFIIIPQNGHELITEDSEADGQADMTYLGAIDGQGREDLFYGYDEDNVATPEQESNEMIAFLNIAKENNVQALVTDYCSTPENRSDSYTQNNDLEYTSFAADHRELDNIPEDINEPYYQHEEDVSSLANTYNFLYLLNPGEFGNKESFLTALKDTDYDLFIIDAYYDGTSALISIDLDSLKEKDSGGSRLVIAYMSIGEAEDYRYYWDEDWDSDPPGWIEEENPEWEGNYKVRYWDEEWQAIIYGNDDSYVKMIIDAGFDGIYLDIIDAYEYFEENYL